MIGHWLTNNNENATVSFCQKFRQPNWPLVLQFPSIAMACGVISSDKRKTHITSPHKNEVPLRQGFWYLMAKHGQNLIPDGNLSHQFIGSWSDVSAAYMHLLAIIYAADLSKLPLVQTTSTLSVPKWFRIAWHQAHPVFVFTFPKVLLRPLPFRCTIHQVVAEYECWPMFAKTAKKQETCN